MKNYLKVTYKFNGESRSQEFLTKEAYLITKVLKEQADDDKCEVELIECTEKEFKIIFG